MLILLFEELRVFPTHFTSILYFISSKSHFSILTTHFYKTPPILFYILQYIILKYYKIILFIYIFFSHSNQTHSSRSTTTSTSRSAATTHNPHTHAGKPKPKPKPTTTIPTPANPNPNPYFVCNHGREGGEKSAIESHDNHPNTNPITATNHHHQQIWKQPSTHHQQIRKQPPTHNHLH